MITNPSYLSSQYDMICQSRSILFEYCKTISVRDFIEENSSFGRGGSIRNLLVHIANTYEFWISKHTLNKHLEFTPYDNCGNIADVIKLFTSIDEDMREFMILFDQNLETEILLTINGSPKKMTPFKLFTHVITHEFHHKGQVLSLSRHLGYTPVDTDIIR